MRLHSEVISPVVDSCSATVRSRVDAVLLGARVTLAVCVVLTVVLLVIWVARGPHHPIGYRRSDT